MLAEVRQVEQGIERFRLLSARYRVLAVDDETRHRIDTHPARPQIFRRHLRHVSAARQIRRNGVAVETDSVGDTNKDAVLADVFTLEKVRREQRLADFVLQAAGAGKAD